MYDTRSSDKLRKRIQVLIGSITSSSIISAIVEALPRLISLPNLVVRQTWNNLDHNKLLSSVFLLNVSAELYHWIHSIAIIESFTVLMCNSMRMLCTNAWLLHSLLVGVLKRMKMALIPLISCPNYFVVWRREYTPYSDLSLPLIRASCMSITWER